MQNLLSWDVREGEKQEGFCDFTHYSRLFSYLYFSGMGLCQPGYQVEIFSLLVDWPLLKVDFHLLYAVPF